MTAHQYDLRSMSKHNLVLTGDILRPFRVRDRWESATWKNLRWLDGIVGTAARMAGWNVRTVAWDSGLSDACGYFDTPAVYDALDLPLSFEGWATLMTMKRLPEPIATRILARFENAVVVGYEMPDVLRDLFDTAGIPVLDLILHPVRFLDDAVFALSTNRADIHRLLLHHQLDPNVAMLQAGFIKSKAAWMRPPMRLKPGSALVLGQVATDRASVDRSTGKFTHLGDHIEAVLDLCTRCPDVLFKPHPYDDTQSPSKKAMRQLKSVIWTDANLYHLLSQPEISIVCAISSSGLVEAEIFGKDTVWLGSPLYTFGDAAPPEAGGFGAAVAQDTSWTSPEFWQALATGEPVDCRPGLPPRSNRLRRSLNADWGFTAIDKVVA